MERYYCFTHHALQKRATKILGSWEEDKLCIRIKLYKLNFVSMDPLDFDNQKLSQRDFSVKFSHIKQQLSNFGSDREYESLISEHLKSMGVPEDEHSSIAHSMFLVVEAAVTPVDAVVVFVWDTTYPPGYHPLRANFVPTSRSLILALEQVTLDSDIIAQSPSCVVCLDYFEHRIPVTRLPCRHHFHLHCIVQCLEVNNMCPLCRYSMPTGD